MNPLKTLVIKTKVYKSLPEGRLKKMLRCLIYKLPLKVESADLIAEDKGTFYEIKFEGVKFKFRHRHFKSFLKGGDVQDYIKEYHLKKGDVVIDAGAYPGDFTLYAAKKVGQEGQVIAFEPNDANFEKLKKNIQLNDLGNVILVKKGLWSANKQMKFRAKDTASSLFNTSSSRYNNKVTKVEVVKLDDELSQLGISQINFIKMDIEGAEIEAIKGGENTLKKNDVHLAIGSYHLVDGKKTCHEVERLLSAFGYIPHTHLGGHLTTYAKKGK